MAGDPLNPRGSRAIAIGWTGESTLLSAPDGGNGPGYLRQYALQAADGAWNWISAETDRVEAALSYRAFLSYEARIKLLGTKLLGASTWSQIYSAANILLGPRVYEFGIMCGVADSLKDMISDLLGLMKMLLLAGMYEELGLQGGKRSWIMEELPAFLGKQMEEADTNVRNLIHQLGRIIRNPVQFLGDTWASTKKDYVNKWNYHVQLLNAGGLTNKFEAGRIAGEVLAQVMLAILAILSAGGAIAKASEALLAKLSSEAPDLLKLTQTLKVAEDAKAAGGAGSVAEEATAGGTQSQAPAKTAPPPPAPKSPIDYDHAIGADYNKRSGKPTGGHSLLKGDVRIVPGTETSPDANGVYKATIQVPDPNNPGQWVTKTANKGMNTMFPKDWTESRIKSEVDAAWNSPNKAVDGDEWNSRTPSGVAVGGYLTPNTTVFPLYEGPNP